MNKGMLKKVVASKIVDMAVQTAKMPNQVCPFFMGKPKTSYDLTSDDYISLTVFMKRK